jgi:hypothetical protein
MGSVDQTKLHLLVRRGGMGWVKNEGERVDIALVGPDTDDGLIVQFLSMSYEETEAVEEHKRSAIDLVERMVELGRGRPWKYARYRTGTGANAYSHVRLFTQEGKNPLQRVEKAQRRPTGFRAEQLPSVEGIGPFGRFVVYNNGKYVGIHLIRGDLTIKGWIAELSPGHVAVSVTQPLKVCGMRTRLFDPYENGHLLDKDAVLNSYGLEVTVKLTNDIYEAASTMERRIGDIGPAMTAALRKALAAEGSLELGSEEWMHEVLDGLPGPPLDIDFVLFDSILLNWISRDCYGLRAIAEGTDGSNE